MRLLIFPGGGSPDDTVKYASVYRLLKEAAPSFGYSNADISLRWPGHVRSPSARTVGLTLDGAFCEAHIKLAEYEKRDEPYDIVARSFGVYVALYATTRYAYSKLRRMVLWGSPPFWYMWQLFVPQLGATQSEAVAKGLIADHKLFPSLEPVECLLQQSTSEVILATGSADLVSSPAFQHYLIQLANRSNVTERTPVEGAKHDVTADDGAKIVNSYLTAVLGQEECHTNEMG